MYHVIEIIGPHGDMEVKVRTFSDDKESEAVELFREIVTENVDNIIEEMMEPMQAEERKAMIDAATRNRKYVDDELHEGEVDYTALIVEEH